MFKVTILISCLIICITQRCARAEIFTAQVELEGLFQLRKSVTDAITEYLDKEELRLETIRKYFKASSGLNRLNGPTTSVNLNDRLSNNDNENVDEDDKSALYNPITSFMAIKGLTIDLTDVLLPAFDRKNIVELEEVIQNLHANRKFPGKDDVKGAAEALTRLQETYQLSTNAMSKGCLHEAFCSLSLSVDDCFEIGKQSYKIRNFNHAATWLKEALRKLDGQEHDALLFSEKNDSNNNDNVPLRMNQDKSLTLPAAPTTSRTEILDYLTWAQDINKTLSIGKMFLSELTGLEFDAFVDEVVKVADSFPSEEEDESVSEAARVSYATVLKKYEALCRGEGKELMSMNSQLKCSYSTRNDLYFLIGPIKEEQVNLDPPIWIFHNVIYETEMEIIKTISRPMFKTATVVNSFTGGTEKSTTRVSKSAWLIDEDDYAVEKVNRRISWLTNLDLDTAEDLQVANYGIGGMYLPHYDYSHTNETIRFLPEDEGNRIATLMFYMSNVQVGGATAFPHLNLSLWPEKGSAAFWYNLRTDGRGDPRTQHGACPVLVGSKWVSNKWIHERGQEFRRLCDLQQNGKA